MTWRERIRYLRRAALRAEGEGDRRVAEALRRMAREAMPVEASRRTRIVRRPAGCGSE